MHLTLGVVCSQGVGPTRGGQADNGDNYLICQHGRRSWRQADGESLDYAEGHGTLLAVAASAGEGPRDLAATTTVRVIAKLYGAQTPQKPARAMRRYLLDAHARLHAQTLSRGPRLAASTTTVWILGHTAHRVQIGGCRLYLFRENRLTQVTSDQTTGELALRDALAPPPHPKDLAQAFMFGDLRDSSQSDLRVDPGLDTGAEPLEHGDRLILCSPGLHRAVDDSSLADLLRNVPDPQAAAVACVERAMARGATTNLTATVVAVSG